MNLVCGERFHSWSNTPDNASLYRRLSKCRLEVDNSNCNHSHRISLLDKLTASELSCRTRVDLNYLHKICTKFEQFRRYYQCTLCPTTFSYWLLLQRRDRGDFDQTRSISEDHFQIKIKAFYRVHKIDNTLVRHLRDAGIFLFPPKSNFHFSFSARYRIDLPNSTRPLSSCLTSRTSGLVLSKGDLQLLMLSHYDRSTWKYSFNF